MIFCWLRRAITLLTVVFSFLVFLPASAQDTFPPPDGTVWGDPQPLGNGQIQTFVTPDDAGNPSLVGVAFTESALTGLPQEPSDGRWDVKDASGNVVVPCCGHELVLEFPETDTPILFQHFVINWNPAGHMPADVYDVPHFDLHFYMISNEERMAFEPATADTMCSVPNWPDDGGEQLALVSCETFEEATIPLPADQMPPEYLDVGDVAPGMGNHLIDSQAPEIADGEPFTYTWIYGTYGGRLTFGEPMITIDFLEERNEEVCAEIAMPQAMSEPGFYPSEYCIRYMDGETEGTFVVSLESFVEY
jgi:hypothetical protein